MPVLICSIYLPWTRKVGLALPSVWVSDLGTPEGPVLEGLGVLEVGDPFE